jgi:hypothetical protein
MILSFEQQPDPRAIAASLPTLVPRWRFHSVLALGGSRDKAVAGDLKATATLTTGGTSGCER